MKYLVGILVFTAVLKSYVVSTCDPSCACSEQSHPTNNDITSRKMPTGLWPWPFPFPMKILCRCLNIYEPVCASDGVTYSNRCIVDCINANLQYYGLPLLNIKYKGECGCNCNKCYDPVCGSDGKTYNNICLLQCENERRIKLGLSPIPPAYMGRCLCKCSNQNCPSDFKPVCGSDGKTYWNQCWLVCHSMCNKMNNLPPIHPVKIGYC